MRVSVIGCGNEGLGYTAQLAAEYDIEAIVLLADAVVAVTRTGNRTS